MGGAPFLGAGELKTQLSRWDFLTAGDQSPMRNSKGVGGSAFLERRRNLAFVLLVGGNKKSTNCSMCSAYQSQMRKNYFVLFFSERMRSFSRLGFLGGERTPSAAKSAGVRVGAVPHIVLLNPFTVTLLF